LAQADLPGKTASGWRGKDPIDPQFLARGYNGDLSLAASNGKVMG